MFDDIINSRIPVFLDENRIPCFQPETGSSPYKVIVAAIPKSGTYLTGKLLQNMGVVDTQIHLNGAAKSVNDYRFATMDYGKKNPKELQRDISFKSVLELTQTGQFLLSHLTSNKEIREQVIESKAKVVFCVRNLRNCLVSFMRWQASTGRGTSLSVGWGEMDDSPEKLLAYVENEGKTLATAVKRMIGWHNWGQAYTLPFEALTGEKGIEDQLTTVGQLSKYLSIDLEGKSLEDIIAKTLGASTMTKSEKRSEYEPYWSEKAEEFFAASGLLDFNKRLGY